MITCSSLNTGGLGRFGNQIWSAASTIGVAVKNNQPFAFPEWINRDNLLFGGNADKIEDYLLNPLPRIPEGIYFTDIPYHWTYREYNIPTGNWNICSHLQSERYIKHCLPLIRQTFTFKDEPGQNDYVAIHYRAGDYIDDPAAHHPRCSREYYQQAMKQFPNGTRFIVFSDNPRDAWEVLDHYAIFFVDLCTGGSYIDDFKKMKRCKSFITANSSFSLMAAILGDHPEKKIVCPARFFGTGMPPEFDTKDIYPEGAIII